MKKLTLSIPVLLATLLLFTLPVSAQLPMNWCNNEYHTARGFTFDFNTLPDSSVFYIKPDTSQHRNLWQTGRVNKPFFTLGVPGNRALTTDTLLPYPAGNISSFTFRVINCPGIVPWGVYTDLSIYFSFSINSDTLRDGGTVEVSHDNGLTWKNVILDTVNTVMLHNFYTIRDTVTSLKKPGFSGNRRDISASIDYKPRYQPDIDTIAFRFTFGSDSIQTGKDGWMISTLSARSFYEGVAEHDNRGMITIFPIPATSEFFIRINSAITKGAELQVEDCSGRTVRVVPVTGKIIPIGDLQPGIYLVKYNSLEFSVTRKVIII